MPIPALPCVEGIPPPYRRMTETRFAFASRHRTLHALSHGTTRTRNEELVEDSSSPLFHFDSCKRLLPLAACCPWLLGSRGRNGDMLQYIWIVCPLLIPTSFS